MPKLQYAVLNYNESVKRLTSFIPSYNEGKTSGQQLKEQHISLFRRIVSLVSKKQYAINKLNKGNPLLRMVDDTKEYLLLTNNVKLSWVEQDVPVSPRTVARRIERLMESGVITKKISHGSLRNYELFINPAFLCFYDRTPKKEQNLKSSENTDNEEENKTNCPSRKTRILKKENNLIIPVKKEINRSTMNFKIIDLKKIDKKKGTGLNEGSNFKPKVPLIPNSSQEKKKNVAPAPPEKSKLRQYQEDTGVCFFNYVRRKLFSDRTEIVETAFENARNYVANNYFVRTTSMSEADKLLKILQRRVDVAARWLQMKKYNLQNIFPSQYLNLSRRGINPHTGKSYMSFVNLARWENNFKELKKADKVKRTKDNRERAYYNVLNAYYEMPKIEMFRKCFEYLKEKLPEYADTFLKEIANQKSA